MSEPKDPAIKLFGRRIQLPEIPAPSADSGGKAPPPSSDTAFDDGLSKDRPSLPNSIPEDNNSNGVAEEQGLDKDLSGGKLIDAKEEDGAQPLTSEKFSDPNATSVTNDNPKTPSVDNEAPTVKILKTEEQSETSNSQEKTLKKPDKILPCPRCNSMDTKFCYYNNYNVNQPRHFCKNCHRYWTAGGTMRNVPVGAGRRKNKNLAAHHRHITVAEALHNAQADLPNGIHHPALKANGAVLTFGSDSTVCESMASVLETADNTIWKNCPQNGFHKPEELRNPVSYGSGDNGDVHSSGSSVTDANSKEEIGKTGLQDPIMQNCHSFCPQVPCFPGAPWPYPWNSAQWNSPVPIPTFCLAGFPIPFYPASPYWGCTVPGSWNVHWVTPSSSSNHTAHTYGPNSPTLGKHSRDENVLKSTNSGEGEGEEEPQKENNPEKCLWFPKTLRIDDPQEAARSSIWATLGIKNDKAGSFSGGGLFKAFRSKGDEKNHISETSPVLQANPAALSRSHKFRENS